MGDESIKETPWYRFAINTGAEWIVYDAPRGWPVGAGYIKARGLSEEEMQEYLDCWEGECVRDGINKTRIHKESADSGGIGACAVFARIAEGGTRGA